MEKLALIFLYNFHREHSLLKSIIKKVSPKINVKNIKNRVYICIYYTLSFNVTLHILVFQVY